MLRSIVFLALLTLPTIGDAPHALFGDERETLPEDESHTPQSGPFGDHAGDIRDRLHEIFFVRVNESGESHGHDAVDPLLWRDSRHLLVGDPHRRACETLDEFIQQTPPSAPRDVLKDAVLQNDLWSVFDWTLAGESSNDTREQGSARRQLRTRLAMAIRRLALSPSKIDSLPDTYHDAVVSKKFARHQSNSQPDDPHERAFLPPELFDPQGPWVCLYDTPLAPAHADHFSRSAFLVFIKLPSGREETLDYFRRLNLFPNPILPNERPFGRVGTGANQRRVRGALWQVNPKLPQIPVGTQVALVRRMMLIDSDGQLVASKICQMVQLRVYREVVDGIDLPAQKRENAQDFFEFKMSRSSLFAKDAGGLKLVDLAVPSYTTFMSHGEVAFRHRPNRPSCSTCHQKSGIHSIQSYARFGFTQAAMHGSQLKQIGAGRERDVYWAIRRKQQRADWGLLRGIWEQSVMTSEDSAQER